MRYLLEVPDEFASTFNIKAIVQEVDNKLTLIEVKGESVTVLYHARVILKALYDAIKEEKKIEEDKEE